MSACAQTPLTKIPAVPPPFAALLDGVRLIAFVAAQPENDVTHVTRGLAAELNSTSPGRAVAIDRIGDLRSLPPHYESVLLACTTTKQAALADRVVLVVEAGATPRIAIERTRRLLQAAGVQIAGCVLNRK